MTVHHELDYRSLTEIILTLFAGVESAFVVFSLTISVLSLVLGQVRVEFSYPIKSKQACHQIAHY